MLFVINFLSFCLAVYCHMKWVMINMCTAQKSICTEMLVTLMSCISKLMMKIWILNARDLSVYCGFV